MKFKHFWGNFYQFLCEAYENSIFINSLFSYYLSATAKDELRTNSLKGALQIAWEVPLFHVSQRFLIQITVASLGMIRLFPLDFLRGPVRLNLDASSYSSEGER